MNDSSRKTVTSFIARPADANTIGTIFGGIILKHMDMAAAICARRHSNTRVTTVAVDDLRFYEPLTVGLVVRLEAELCRTFTTSMDIRIRVFGEDSYSGKEFLAAQGNFTVVCLDKQGKPTAVPPFTPESDEERKLWHEAGERRERRRRTNL